VNTKQEFVLVLHEPRPTAQVTQYWMVGWIK